MRPLATFHNRTWTVWAILVALTAGLLQGADNAQPAPPPSSSDRNALMQKLLQQMLEQQDQEETSPAPAIFPPAEAAPQPQNKTAEPAQFPPSFGPGTPPVVLQNALPTTPFQPTTPSGNATTSAASQPPPTNNAVAGQIGLPSGEDAGLRIVPTKEMNPATEAIPHTFNFPNSPIEPIFEMFTELTGKMVLYAPNVEGTVNLISGSVELSRAEAIEAITSSLALSGIILVPMGEKFVKAVLAEEAVQHAPQIYRAEPELLPESGEFITRTVKLNQVKPSEAVEVLKSLTKTPEGLIPIDSSQTLWIHSDASSMKQMLEVLETIDVVPEDYYSLEVIPIRYSKVGDLYNTMQSLISGSPAADPAATSTSPNQGTLGGRGFGTGFGTGFGGFGGGYGGGGYGSRNYRSGGYRPYQASSTTASNQRNFQDRLQKIVSKASEEEEVPLLSQAKFVPDHRSNSLLIFANQQDLTMITNMISKVDRLLAQVLIEAVIMEINLGDDLNLGVSLAQQLESRGKGKWTFGGGVNNPNTSTEVGLGTGNNFLPESLTNAVPFLTNALPGGFNYFGKYNDTLQAAVSAIATDSSTRVISRPRIQTSHAVPGLFSLGERRPFASGGYTSGYTSAGAFNSVEYLDINIQLFVTPYVTPEGYIVMDIAQTANTHVGDVPIVTNTGSPPNDTPIVGQREAQATLSVKDGDTIMLGGYIRQRKVKTRSGVPLLKDIPLLGGLFRSKSNENERREMIILLRAKVLETPEEAALVASQERDNIDGIREMEEDFEAERLGKNQKRSRLPRR